jgi:type II secretory pathway pseudopilin PulG
MLERGIGRAVQALEPSADRESVVERLLKRLRAEEGFGLIELAMAMVMLNIGILAIVAAFNSGAVALRRASLVANATAIADTYMERYRGFRNCQIYVDTAANGGIPASGTAYQSDPAYNATQITQSYAGAGSIPATCSLGSGTWTCPASGAGTATTNQLAVTAHNQCAAGPDNRTYIVDLYIVSVSVTSGGTQKQVTVVVRDPANPTKSLVRESSTFDPYAAT